MTFEKLQLLDRTKRRIGMLWSSFRNDNLLAKHVIWALEFHLSEF